VTALEWAQIAGVALATALVLIVLVITEVGVVGIWNAMRDALAAVWETIAAVAHRVVHGRPPRRAVPAGGTVLELPGDHAAILSTLAPDVRAALGHPDPEPEPEPEHVLEPPGGATAVVPLAIRVDPNGKLRQLLEDTKARVDAYERTILDLRQQQAQLDRSFAAARSGEEVIEVRDMAGRVQLFPAAPEPERL